MSLNQKSCQGMIRYGGQLWIEKDMSSVEVVKYTPDETLPLVEVKDHDTS